VSGWKVTRVDDVAADWSSSTSGFPANRRWSGEDSGEALGGWWWLRLRRKSPNVMAVLVLRKNDRKVEFRGWQLLCTKNTPRKLKLSVDSITQTQLRIWNLALMPKWLRSQERNTLNISKENTLFYKLQD
jgi:hypothetical protein